MTGVLDIVGRLRAAAEKFTQERRDAVGGDAAPAAPREERTAK